MIDYRTFAPLGLMVPSPAFLGAAGLVRHLALWVLPLTVVTAVAAGAWAWQLALR